MSTSDWSFPWRAKIGEAVERVRSRYHHIGRKTAAPFLCVVYPPDQEIAVHNEWHAQSAALSPDFALHRIDALESTSRILEDIGVENIVDALERPGPGETPQEDLAAQFVTTLAAEILEQASAKGRGPRPVISVERLAALYPACGPRDLMQALWDRAHSTLDVPVILLVPGVLRDVRTYSFLGFKDEFMYRGDLL